MARSAPACRQSHDVDEEALKKIAYSTGTTTIVSTVANNNPAMIVTAIDTKNASIGKAVLLIVGSTAALWFGSEVLVIGAKGIAESFEVPQELIGLTVLAIGTSLPELAATWALAKRGEAPISAQQRKPLAYEVW